MNEYAARKISKAAEEAAAAWSRVADAHETTMRLCKAGCYQEAAFEYERKKEEELIAKMKALYAALDEIEADSEETAMQLVQGKISVEQLINM